jgi:hypothetical protein
MRKLFLSLIFITSLVSGNSSAFDNKITHPELTKEAIEDSAVGQYLIKNLNIPDGVSTCLGMNTAGKSTIKGKGTANTIRNWLIEGSYLEDEPNCRASNHFHDPLMSWTDSYMSDQPWFINMWCSGGEYPLGNIKSAVHWATGYTEPSPGGAKPGTNNQWDWDHAREYYYIYLTGKDYDESVVADTEEQRKKYFADSLQAVGQVLHLLQDMAVPAHVRNDFKSHLDFHGITWETLFHSIEKTQGDIT